VAVAAVRGKIADDGAGPRTRRQFRRALAHVQLAEVRRFPPLSIPFVSTVVV
jgi:hypothetical protein